MSRLKDLLERIEDPELREALRSELKRAQHLSPIEERLEALEQMLEERLSAIEAEVNRETSARETERSSEQNVLRVLRDLEGTEPRRSRVPARNTRIITPQKNVKQILENGLRKELEKILVIKKDDNDYHRKE